MSSIADLINKCAVIARKHSNMALKIDQMCEERYGATVGELDIDEIIDSKDYGATLRFTQERIDQLLKNALDEKRKKQEL